MKPFKIYYLQNKIIYPFLNKFFFFFIILTKNYEYNKGGGCEIEEVGVGGVS